MGEFEFKFRECDIMPLYNGQYDNPYRDNFIFQTLLVIPPGYYLWFIDEIVTDVNGITTVKGESRRLDKQVPEGEEEIDINVRYNGYCELHHMDEMINTSPAKANTEKENPIKK